MISPRGDLSADRPARIFLYAVAALYAYGGLVHLANMLSLSGFDWLSSPFLWRVFDVVFLALDIAVVAGVLLRRWWAAVMFALTAGLQIMLYAVFPASFAQTPEQASALKMLLIVNAVLLAIFAGLLVRARAKSKAA